MANVISYTCAFPIVTHLVTMTNVKKSLLSKRTDSYFLNLLLQLIGLLNVKCGKKDRQLKLLFIIMIGHKLYYAMQTKSLNRCQETLPQGLKA